jgi:hypothetical protein
MSFQAVNAGFTGGGWGMALSLKVEGSPNFGNHPLLRCGYQATKNGSPKTSDSKL